MQSWCKRETQERESAGGTPSAKQSDPQMDHILVASPAFQVAASALKCNACILMGSIFGEDAQPHACIPSCSFLKFHLKFNLYSEEIFLQNGSHKD